MESSKYIQIQGIKIYNPNDLNESEDSEANIVKVKTPPPSRNLKIERQRHDNPPRIKSSTAFIPPKKKGRYQSRKTSRQHNLHEITPSHIGESSGESFRTYIVKNINNQVDLTAGRNEAVFSVSGTQQLTNFDDDNEVDYYGTEFPIPKYFEAYISGKWHSTEASWKFVLPFKLRLSSSLPEKQKDFSTGKHKFNENNGSREIKTAVHKLGKLPKTFESNFAMPVYLTEAAYDSTLELKLNELDEINRNHPPTKKLKIGSDDDFPIKKLSSTETSTKEPNELGSGESSAFHEFSSGESLVQRKDSLNLIFHESSLQTHSGCQLNSKYPSSSETDDDLKHYPNEDTGENVWDSEEDEKLLLAEKNYDKNSINEKVVKSPKPKFGKAASLFMKINDKIESPEDEIKKTKSSTPKKLISNQNLCIVTSSFQSLIAGKLRGLKNLEIVDSIPRFEDSDYNSESIAAWTKYFQANDVEYITDAKTSNDSTEVKIESYISEIGVSDELHENIQSNEEIEESDLTDYLDENDKQLEAAAREMQEAFEIERREELLQEEKIIPEKATAATETHDLNAVNTAKSISTQKDLELENNSSKQKDLENAEDSKQKNVEIVYENLNTTTEKLARSQSRQITANSKPKGKATFDKSESILWETSEKPKTKKKVPFLKGMFSLFQTKKKPVNSNSKPAPEKKGFFQKFSLIFARKTLATIPEEDVSKLGKTNNQPKDNKADNPVLAGMSGESENLKHVDSAALIRQKRWKLFQEAREFYQDSVMAYQSAMTRSNVHSEELFPPPDFMGPSDPSASSKLDGGGISKISNLLNLGSMSILGIGQGYKSTVSESVILPAMSRRKRRLNQNLLSGNLDKYIDEVVEEQEKPQIKSILKNKPLGK